MSRISLESILDDPFFRSSVLFALIFDLGYNKCIDQRTRKDIVMKYTRMEFAVASNEHGSRMFLALRDSIKAHVQQARIQYDKDTSRTGCVALVGLVAEAYQPSELSSAEDWFEFTLHCKVTNAKGEYDAESSTDFMRRVFKGVEGCCVVPFGMTMLGGNISQEVRQ